MSTRATIKIQHEDETYFVYRHCDGFPEDVLPDIEAAIKRNASLSCAEPGHLVSLLLGMTFRPEHRIQSYEMTPCFHGDESYRYFVTWDGKQWAARVGEKGEC